MTGHSQIRTTNGTSRGKKDHTTAIVSPGVSISLTGLLRARLNPSFSFLRHTCQLTGPTPVVTSSSALSFPHIPGRGRLPLLKEDVRWGFTLPVPSTMRGPFAPGSVLADAPTQSGIWTRRPRTRFHGGHTAKQRSFSGYFCLLPKGLTLPQKGLWPSKTGQQVLKFAKGNTGFSSAVPSVGRLPPGDMARGVFSFGSRFFFSNSN